MPDSQSHTHPLLILIAGPYRSGTGDDPARMRANVEAMEEFAVPLVTRCDAIMRIDGASAGADEMVRLAQDRGLPVYRRLEDVPSCA